MNSKDREQKGGWIHHQGKSVRGYGNGGMMLYNAVALPQPLLSHKYGGGP